MCVAYIFLFLDSHLATLWESNCPFGFLLAMFPLGSSYFVFVFPFDVSDGRCGIIVSIPDHCVPFYFVNTFYILNKYIFISNTYVLLPMNMLIIEQIFLFWKKKNDNFIANK